MEQNISSLNLSAKHLQTLKSSGFNYLTDVPKSTNFSEWSELTFIPATKTALDIYYEQAESGTIYLFNRELDNLLENEMVPGNIVEICGEPASGTTQICFQLCINVQLPKWIGGKEGGAMYLSTNYNFCREKVEELCQLGINRMTSIKISEERSFQSDLNVATMLKNIHHIQIKTYDEFLACIIFLRKWLKNYKIYLLVVDCIMPLVQQLNYKRKRKFIYNIFADLQKLALEHGFVIVVTNSITIRMRSANNIYKTAALGEAYYHRINSRVALQKLSQNWFKATLEKSVLKKESTAIFQL